MGLITDLLKEIPSAARYKAELEAMEKENSVLKSQVSELRQEIKRRDDIIKKYEEQSHKSPLNELKIKIMVAIASSEHQTLMEYELATATELKSIELTYHLHELEETQHIEKQNTYFSLTQKGRKLLLDNNLA